MPDNSPIIEIVQIGMVLKITAVDPVTGIEAVVTAPASAATSQHELRQFALRKLQRLLANAGQKRVE